MPGLRSEVAAGREAPAVSRRAAAVAAGGLAAFVALTALVQARWLAGSDLAAAQAVQAAHGSLLDWLAGAISVAVAAEVSLLAASLAAALLWRRGLGLWSLAPVAFVLLIPLEMALKATIQQSFVSPELYRSPGVAYPFLTLRLNGAFPSGHALRTGFLVVFLAATLAPQRGRRAWVARLGLGALALFFGFTRLYLGHHWLSDVLAGLVLGASLALLVAPPVGRRLRGGGGLSDAAAPGSGRSGRRPG